MRRMQNVLKPMAYFYLYLKLFLFSYFSKVCFAVSFVYWQLLLQPHWSLVFVSLVFSLMCISSNVNLYILLLKFITHCKRSRIRRRMKGKWRIVMRWKKKKRKKSWISMKHCWATVLHNPSTTIRIRST